MKVFVCCCGSPSVCGYEEAVHDLYTKCFEVLFRDVSGATALFDENNK